MKKTLLFAITLITIFSTSVSAQIFQESFESAPGGSYSLTTAFDDGGFDYFGQYAVPDTTNGGRDDFMNGWDGGFGIHSQDHDGEGGPATVTVDVPGINIAGFTGLSATISLGALNSELAGFDNYEAADGDSLQIFATVDAAAPALIGAFAPPAAGMNNGMAAGDLYLDTDGDGVGDGVGLTVDLTDFTFPVAGTGNTLDISIALTSTDSFEPFALDNLRINAVPEPNAAILLLLGVCGISFGRRKTRHSVGC